MARRHGTMSCYTGGCRRPECAAAMNRRQRARVRQIAYGLPTTDLVDATPAREHVIALVKAGFPLERQADQAGVARSTLQKIVYGSPSEGRGPTRRIRPHTAERLLALTLTLDTAPPKTQVDKAGTFRRVLSMGRLGYSPAWQARQIGRSHRDFMRRVMEADKVSADMARKIRDLHERVWNRPAPMVGVALRTARWAEAKGGLLPMQLDDDMWDLTDAELAAELSRRAGQMDTAELVRCYKAAAEGDRSPLIVAGAGRYLEVRREKRAARTAA